MKAVHPGATDIQRSRAQRALHSLSLELPLLDQVRVRQVKLNHLVRRQPEIPWFFRPIGAWPQNTIVAELQAEVLGKGFHRFELVVCDHVLQYYPEEAQIEFLTRLVKAVQPDGYLYASTPTPSVRDAIARDFGFAPVARNLYRGGSSPS